LFYAICISYSPFYATLFHATPFRTSSNKAVIYQDPSASILNSMKENSVRQDCYTILLVDDNDKWSQEVKRYLEGPACARDLKKQVEVAVENDGNQALERYRELEPTVLILDIDLGPNVITGLELCARFSQSAAYQQRQLGIIVMSAKYVNLDAEIQGMRLGAHYYVAVDGNFHLSLLAARLNALLNQIDPSPETLAVDERLKINFDEQSVTVDGERCKLSPAEYEILAYLAQSPGQVKTRHDIQRHAFIDAIAKIMVGLRNKITPDDLERDHYIQSVRGVGYRLNV